MSSFRADILTASGPFYQGELESLIVPLVDGMYGIRAGHANLISSVVPGKIRMVLPGGEIKRASVSGGMVKSESGKVLVLLDFAKEPVNEAEAIEDTEGSGIEREE